MSAFYQILCLLSMVAAVPSQNIVEPCPSHEWSLVCDDCKCDDEMLDAPLKSDGSIDTLDACKTYAESQGYDIVSFKDETNKCRVGYETWCSSTQISASRWETHKLTVEKCPELDTTVWSNMKGFSSVCSDDEHSIEIHIDQDLYVDTYVGEDCKTLCESVGSVCLNGWKDDKGRCPNTYKNKHQIGCTNKNHDSFVCSCAVIDSSDKSKVINYEDCTSQYAVTGQLHDPEDRWPFECPANTAVVSVETKVVEVDETKWTFMSMQCCGLVDKVTELDNCERIPEQPHHRLLGGGSSSVEDQWDAQCGPNAIMVGVWDDDTKGDFDDVDAAKCCTVDSLFTSGEKIDNLDCVVVNLSPNSKSSCPLDYVMVGIYDHEDTQFERVRKMKCCRVLESIVPTVSPSQMPTTDEPSHCPTVSPVTSIPSTSPTTDDPTSYPSHNPTTDQPTNAPSLTPSTSEPSFSPSYNPTSCPSKNPTTDVPTTSPTISPSTDQPTKIPTTSPSTEEPSASPTTEEPSMFPTLSPSTSNPTKFPSQNPTTDDPTAFPSTLPTQAPTMCEPTCRSHTDQMMNILKRLLDFNSVLVESIKYRKSGLKDPLTVELNEMISDLESLTQQMQPFF